MDDDESQRIERALSLAYEIREAGGGGALALLEKFPDVLAEYWRIVVKCCARARVKGRQCVPADLFSTLHPRIPGAKGGLRVAIARELRDTILYRGDVEREFCAPILDDRKRVSRTFTGDHELSSEYVADWDRLFGESWHAISYPDCQVLVHGTLSRAKVENPKCPNANTAE